MNRIQSSAREIVLLALLAAILFIQEEALTFLPNIQLTVFLLVLYSKKLGSKRTTIIIMIHVLLDNLVMGSMNPIYMFFMFVGWMWIPLLLATVFKRIDTAFPLAFTGILFALLYSWTYMIPNCLVYSMPFLPYFMADILFEVLLAASSFISILWLYEPCSRVFDRFF